MKIISLIFIILISTLFIPANFGQEHQQWTHPAYDEWNSGHNPQNIINRDNILRNEKNIFIFVVLIINWERN